MRPHCLLPKGSTKAPALTAQMLPRQRRYSRLKTLATVSPGIHVLSRTYGGNCVNEHAAKLTVATVRLGLGPARLLSIANVRFGLEAVPPD